VPIRLIHVGVGVRGRHWLDIVAAHADFVSVACVDPDERALAEARRVPGQEHGLFFTSLEQAVQKVRADAVLIASPTALHAAHTVRALQAGLGVLVEKPLAGNLEEAIAIIAQSDAAQRPVMVAENYRFFAAERTLRRMLDQDVTGRIRSVVCTDRRDQPSETQGGWVKNGEHPFLAEIAVHHYDSFRYLFKRQPVSVFARAYNPPGSTYERNAAVQAIVELDGGLPVQYFGTFVAHRYEFSLWIEGEKGDLWTDRRRVWSRPRGRRFFLPARLAPVPKGDELPYPKAGTVSLLNQFRDAMLHGTVAETDARDNVWTLAMVEASIASHRDRRVVQIDELFTPDLQTRASALAR
jgi:predicted dehydrogenase